MDAWFRNLKYFAIYFEISFAVGTNSNYPETIRSIFSILCIPYQSMFQTEIKSQTQYTDQPQIQSE